MRTNQLRTMFEEERVVMNGWVSIDSPYLAEVLSYSGYDAVTVDMQHGMFGLDGAVRLIQAVSAGPAVPLARCPSLDAATIGKLLDAGAYGIICPSIDTSQQAEALVDACRYPPIGNRSFGPSRGLLYGGADYVDKADETILVWAMIESVTALQNLDAILAVPGIDGVFVGPNDLALSFGERPGQADFSEAVWAALRLIADRAHRAGVRVGAFCGNATLGRALIASGYDLVTPGNDAGIIRDAVKERLGAIRSDTPAPRTAGGY
jgi:4-hydroxy-2-oxoheptanedioate aldolase